MVNAEYEFGPTLMGYVDAELDRRGMSRNALAAVTNVSASQFSRWKHGELVPSIDAIVNVALALDISPVDLFTLVIGQAEEGEEGAPRHAPTIEEAVALDPALDDGKRAALLAMVNVVRKHR